MYAKTISVVLTPCTVSVLRSTEVCHALNVTVTPGPVVMATEKDNITLSCLVSQRKRSSSVLILRWFFSPLPSQVLLVKLGIKKMKIYGNYTRRFTQPKFRLSEEVEGEVYRLRILNLSGPDQGFYTCRVQEIHKHRNTWRASSNGTSTTQLTGN
uniref:V-set and transmembrane domain containing 4a n=1 Tax=Labrus bergylta TaxID=56723 RepID=A0A3Q3MG20_9LABR